MSKHQEFLEEAAATLESTRECPEPVTLEQALVLLAHFKDANVRIAHSLRLFAAKTAAMFSLMEAK